MSDSPSKANVNFDSSEGVQAVAPPKAELHAIEETTATGFEKEVRFAVVMYGGVSLAIYINGVAQELLRLVRSTAPGQKVKGTERVYKQLNYLLADPERDLAKAKRALDGDAPVQTRFIVDILAGTSAGGINGIYLAKALANGQDMEELRRLWVKEGDIALLINDKASVETPLSVQKPPESLLNSRRMYVKLLSAMASMDKRDLRKARTSDHASQDQETKDKCESPFIDELDLFVTTTDIQGVPLPIRLIDDVVFERRHRNVFRFIYSEEGGRNDFMAKYNPFLSYAARCTSSFPFAFEPMRLEDIDPVLDGFRHYGGDVDSRSGSKRWKRFYKEYQGVETIEFRKRSFGDGGYLDNKPFSYATDTLMRRNADVPVDRKLIYIEPSPEHPEDVIDREERPDFLKNTMAALLSLPRYETIREDLRRVMDRNRFVGRLNRIVHGIERDVEEAEITEKRPLDDVDWAKLDLADLVKRKGRGYAGYHRLDISAVTDALAELVARVAGFDEESDYLLAIRCLIKAWRDLNYTYYKDAKRPTMNHFLWSFNLGFPMRRLNFLRSKIDRLHALDKGSAEIIRLRCPEFWNKDSELSEDDKQEFRRELLKIKKVFNDASAELIAEARLLRSPSKPTNPLREAISNLGVGREQLDFILGRKELKAELAALPQVVETDADQLEDNSVERAKTLLENFPAVNEALGTLRDKMAEQIQGVRARVDQACRDAITISGNQEAPPADNTTGHAEPALSNAAVEARRCIGHYYEYFDDYDMTIFSIQYGSDAGESDTVEIIRISPEDAKSLIDERKKRCLKLAGTSLGHFGAFLEALWRENDILWGRLDGAERLITTLLPNAPVQARQLIADAHAAIIAEEIEKRDQGQLKDLLIESMMRTESGRPDVDTLSEFITNLTCDAGIKTALKNKLGDESDRLKDYYLARFDIHSKPRPESTLRSAARATTVVGGMLEGLSDKYHRGGKLAAWVTRLGRVFWGLVEVAVPRSIPNIIAHHWLKLLYLFEALLIALGILFSEGVRDFGWKALGTTLGINVVIVLLSDFMDGKTGAWRKVKKVLIGVAILLILLGVYEVSQHIAADAERLWAEQIRAHATTSIIIGVAAVAVLLILALWTRRRRV